MTAMGDNNDKPDALLNKLDSLMKSGRAENRSNTPPVLTEALPDGQQGPIPTLTNAIDKRSHDFEDEPGGSAEKVQDMIASRLVAGVDREMADLLQELPALQGKLAVLHRSIKFALPQLISLRWEDAAADDVDGTDEAGTDPDQQT